MWAAVPAAIAFAVIAAMVDPPLPWRTPPAPDLMKPGALQALPAGSKNSRRSSSFLEGYPQHCFELNELNKANKFDRDYSKTRFNFAMRQVSVDLQNITNACLWPEVNTTIAGVGLASRCVAYASTPAHRTAGPAVPSKAAGRGRLARGDLAQQLLRIGSPCSRTTSCRAAEVT